MTAIIATETVRDQPLNEKPFPARRLMTPCTSQRQAGVTHLIAERLADYTSLLSGLITVSRDFH
jgi:hypothetical protein